MAGYFGRSPPNLRSVNWARTARPQLAPLPIRSGERITFGSDSLTTGYNFMLPWPTGTGNFNDQVNAILGAGNHIVDVENGQPGTGIEYLAAHLDTIILNSNPTMVILWCGVNDAISPLGVDNFLTKYVDVLARIKGAIPGVKIACIGLGAYTTEHWEIDGVTGLPRWGPTQTPLDWYDNWIRDAAASMGCQFIDWRKWLLAWEVIHNPGGGAFPFATTDGTHYLDVGQKQIAACALQPGKYFTVFP